MLQRLAFIAACSLLAFAQEPQPQSPSETQPESKAEPQADPHAHHHHHAAGGDGRDPMAAMQPGPQGGWYASGSSQVPRETPMYMLHASKGAWDFMFSGVFFGVYTNQTGPRGRDKIFAPNWVMPMASRRFGNGLLTFRSMFTLEPVTITHQRYPLLFQTGELAHGTPIINGQHPHDLFMELGVAWQQKLSERVRLNFFAGPRGEPTLGPPAFPHRQSASEIPTAVISHHYQDSTHISSSVVSAGVTAGPVTLEASGFHGREPDEKRWGMEQGAIDSFATRITVTPTTRWAAQFSAGRINNREELHPDQDTFRTTASLGYSRAFTGGHWTSTIVWGRNHNLEFTQQPNTELLTNAQKGGKNFSVVLVPTREPGYIYNSYLAETTLRFRHKNWIWGRAENTDRDNYLLYEEAPFVRLVEEQRYTRVQVYTAGYEREVASHVSWLSAGLGGQIMWFGVPDNLRPIYGEHPVGMQFFLRLRVRAPE
ncbi:MAG: hypothetical protein ABI972_21035 [Acidobacteriota bacterium]